MDLRLIAVCLFAAFCPFFSDAADTNLPADADARNILIDTGIRTKLIATGEWSKPVSGGHATRISGRLLVYDGAYFTNEFGKPSWFAAPVFVEITNEIGFPTQIFFNWEKDAHFELRDVNGKPADDLKQHGGSGYKPLDPAWGTVPADGVLRWRANGNVETIHLGREHPIPGGLSLFFDSSGGWLIPAGDTNAYFLSATISPQPTNSSPDSSAVWQATLVFPAVKLSAVRH